MNSQVMKALILGSALFICSCLVYSQKTIIWGTVMDSQTGETLIGATVFANDSQVGVSSNNFGFYSISLEGKQQTLLFSFVVYMDSTIIITPQSSQNIDISLNPKSFELSEVVVKAKREDHQVRDVSMGLQQLSIKLIEKIPVLMGERDVMQGVQSLPGISSANEGTTSLSVRGGSFDQNLILLDDAPVYNPAHALSFFSVFNTDALKDVKVYTGAFPAEYGGRLSSIVDLRMRDGNKQNYSGSGSVGLLSSQLTFEGPFLKNRSSFIVSGRYSYAGAMARLASLAGNKLSVLKGTELYFYDVNAKLNHRINEKNHVYLSLYSGMDHFYCEAIDLSSSMSWGNTTGTLRWNHVYSSKLFSNIMLIFSDYRYSTIFLNDARRYRWLAGLQQKGIKANFDFYATPKHFIQFGFNADLHYFDPGRIEARDSSFQVKSFALDRKQNIQAATFLSDEWTISDRLSIYMGIRYSGLINLGEG